MASFSITTKKGKASNDEFYTPLSAWQSISHLVADGSVVWEPFVGASDSVNRMQSTFAGSHVIGSTTDFFETEPPSDCTLIVTNPPYSCKKKIFERLANLGIPFIMLLPIGTASKQYMRPFVPDISLHIPKKRIHFESPTANPDRPNNTPFDVAFLSWRVTATSNHIEFL